MRNIPSRFASGHTYTKARPFASDKTLEYSVAIDLLASMDIGPLIMNNAHRSK
jgi:hypothetical protein